MVWSFFLLKMGFLTGLVQNVKNGNLFFSSPPHLLFVLAHSYTHNKTGTERWTKQKQKYKYNQKWKKPNKA